MRERECSGSGPERVWRVGGKRCAVCVESPRKRKPNNNNNNIWIWPVLFARVFVLFSSFFANVNDFNSNARVKFCVAQWKEHKHRSLLHTLTPSTRVIKLRFIAVAYGGFHHRGGLILSRESMALSCHSGQILSIIRLKPTKSMWIMGLLRNYHYLRDKITTWEF